MIPSTTGHFVQQPVVDFYFMRNTFIVDKITHHYYS